MSTEVTQNAPASDKEKELKEEGQTENNGQSKDETKDTTAGEKIDEKSDEKKPEPASPKPTVHKTNFEKDVVYLYQFPRTPVLPSTSPYCLKVETWLRLAGIKYENVEHKAKFRSRKGQLPFVELNGEEIADSTFIIKELSARFNKDLDAGLTAEQRAVSHAMISMLENHLSWVVLWWRAKYPDSVLKGYQLNLQSALNTRLPNPILNFCYKFTSARKGMKKARAHGIGVHSQEEIVELGMSDLRVLAEQLGEKPFMFGSQPSIADVVVFSHLAQLAYIRADVPHPLRDALSTSFPKLHELVTRIKEQAFPDWEQLCAPPPDPATSKPTATAEVDKDTEPADKHHITSDDNEKGKGDEKEKELEKEKEVEEKKDKEVDGEKEK